MVYLQLKGIHLVKEKISAPMGNVANNHFVINTWEITFDKSTRLLESWYPGGVHLADYL